MLLGFGRGAHALEGAVDAALRGKAVAWPLPAAQAEVVRRLAERLRASEAAVEAAEQRHRESEAALGYQCVRFDLITSGTVDGLWDMSVVAGDPVNDGNEIWWSPQFRRILGLNTEAEFPNQLDSLYSRVHPEDKDAMLAKLLAHIEDRTGRTPFDMKYRLKLKNGQYRWFHARGMTKRAADGTPLRAVGALTDIEAARQMEDVAQTLNLSARDIVAGSGDLSGRTEQQAAALEETASSMEELTSAVRQNAENVGTTNQLIQETSRSARDGGAVVDDVVATMGSIHESSRRIAEIISVIDGIAFQTNILALNAAVEAARAGEQGRGFAVVASEVRSLAQRSATAAKEIKGLIDDSVSKVATGSSLVAKAGQSMQGIVASVQQVTDLMAEIAAASQEQSTGIDQVNTTVMQLDTTTQQNAGLAEEMAASAHALEEKAGELLRSVLANRKDAAPVAKAA